ncbi:DUF4190 domain-containing protein [Curtobacterium sp. NPDC092190]|uniref:DUF4190 domain-containing protein n=1 Tax=Curtobacterium sp. NPDC092190 TaxID=3363973 RepID=UPI00382427D5
MSDQNQWPKPGESSGGDDGRQQQDGQSGSQQPANPSAQPSQGTPYGQGQQASGAPYGQGQQPSGNPYAQQSQQGNPHAASGPQHNPYAPQSQQGNPYAQQSQQGNPYAQQSHQGNPYAQQSHQGNPYAASSPQQNLYAPQQGGNPYASPYATSGYQPYAQRPKTNTLAILSIVFAFAGVVIWPIVILTSPAGAIMGHIALGKIKQTGEGGRGLALAGVIGGWVLTGLYVLFAVIFIIAIASSHSSSDPYGYDSGAFIR